MRQSVNVLAMAGVFLALAAMPKVTNAQTKTILVGIKVEAEGGTTDRGLWTQSGRDLTPRELGALKALIIQRMAEQPGVRIVPFTYKESFIGIVVVAEKLPSPNSGTWYIASSVIAVADKNGTDEFLTHDVLAGPSQESVARSVALQFAAARLAAALGVSK